MSTRHALRRAESGEKSVSRRQEALKLGLFSTKKLGLSRTIQDLAGGLEHFLFFHILGIVTPTD